VELSQLQIFILSKIILYSDHNNIGSIGAKLLTKVSLPALTELLLRNNKIIEEDAN
jgi:hypothetical protein